MIKITGGKELQGKVIIGGSKNAALPILAASLLVSGKLVFNNVPRIGDVETFLEIMSGFGCMYQFKKNQLIIDTSSLEKKGMDFDKIKKIRASILLIAPLLRIFGDIHLPFPGGCNLGARSIDSHLHGLKKIGYDFHIKEEGIDINGNDKSGDITINAGFGVTPTENLIVANVLRKGKTTIKSSAIEPHVMNLIEFLRKAGADIKIRYDHSIIIYGKEKLKGDFEFDIVSDYLQSGTFIILGALSSKEYIDIKNARIDDLYVFLEKLKEAGVKFKKKPKDTLRVYRANKLKATNIQTNIFPGFPTDLQSPFAVLMTQSKGQSKIHEILFEGRLGWLVELENMGAEYINTNPHEALIQGKTKLKGAKVKSWDLRAGAAMIIAGLIAEGKTKISNVDYIHRGYEDIVKKLQSLGADIEET